MGSSWRCCLLLALLAFVLAACSDAEVAPDVESTVISSVAQTVAAAKDVESTVISSVAQTVAAVPTLTPYPTPMPTPSQSEIQATVSAVAAQPSATPRPTSTPAPSPIQTPVPTPTAGATATPVPSPTATMPAVLQLLVETAQVQLALGASTTVTIVLTGAQQGLSGYDLTIALEPAGVAEIVEVSLPDFGITRTSAVPSASVSILIADLNRRVGPAVGAQTLATLRITARSAGTASITIQVKAMDDEQGGGLSPQVRGAKITAG